MVIASNDEPVCLVEASLRRGCYELVSATTWGTPSNPRPHWPGKSTLADDTGVELFDGSTGELLFLSVRLCQNPVGAISMTLHGTSLIVGGQEGNCNSGSGTLDRNLSLSFEGTGPFAR